MPELKHDAGGARSTTASRRVLIVDDNKDAADSLAMLLNLHGYETGVAYEGRQALQVTEEFQPDVAFVDLGLPGMDGCEVARHIRHRPDSARILLVALTGYGRDSDRERSREAGFNAHLVKPVNPSELLHLISQTASLDSGHQHPRAPR